MRDPAADSYSNRDSDTYTHTHTYTDSNGYNHAETCPNAQAASDSAPPTMS